MLDHLALYDTLYALASRDECEEDLFGNCAPLAHEAFSRCVMGDEFPLIWFEVPLGGEPRFDLHVAYSRKTLREGLEFAPAVSAGYEPIFRWYAQEEKGGNGLAFAFDVSEGRIDAPAIHVNVNNAPLADIGRFFELAADDAAPDAFRGFAERLPQDWRVWYAGVHPGRPGSHLRVDCFVDGARKQAYALDPTLLERNLQSCGFTAVSPTLLELAQLILDAPFGLELQFDVQRDGSVGSTMGLSASFSAGTAGRAGALFEDGGPAAAFMEHIKGLGLADDRWRLIPKASFAKLVNVDGAPLALVCAPTFVKLRVRNGLPLDAKLYLQATARCI